MFIPSVDTSFIEKESDYLLAPWDDKSGMLNTLRYLSEVMVNGTDIPGLQGKPGANPIPLAPVEEVYQRGYKQVGNETCPLNSGLLYGNLISDFTSISIWNNNPYNGF